MSLFSTKCYSTPACACGQSSDCRRLSLRTLQMGCTWKTNIILQKDTKFYKNNQDRKSDRAGLSPLTTSASAGLHLQAALATHASNRLHIPAYGIPRLRSEWHGKSDRKAEGKLLAVAGLPPRRCSPARTAIAELFNYKQKNYL